MINQDRSNVGPGDQSGNGSNGNVKTAHFWMDPSEVRIRIGDLSVNFGADWAAEMRRLHEETIQAGTPVSFMSFLELCLTAQLNVSPQFLEEALSRGEFALDRKSFPPSETDD